MEVFHGTTLIVETPLVGVGRKNLDFGEGFYLTNIRQQAIDWAQRPINKDKPQYLNCYELDINKISINNYRYLKFNAYDDAWLDFVIGNRHGEMQWNNYDLVEGGVANDRVFNTMFPTTENGKVIPYPIGSLEPRDFPEFIITCDSYSFPQKNVEKWLQPSPVGLSI